LLDTGLQPSDLLTDLLESHAEFEDRFHGNHPLVG